MTNHGGGRGSPSADMHRHQSSASSATGFATGRYVRFFGGKCPGPVASIPGDIPWSATMGRLTHYLLAEAPIPKRWVPETPLQMGRGLQDPTVYVIVVFGHELV